MHLPGERSIARKHCIKWKKNEILTHRRVRSLVQNSIPGDTEGPVIKSNLNRKAEVLLVLLWTEGHCGLPITSRWNAVRHSRISSALFRIQKHRWCCRRWMFLCAQSVITLAPLLVNLHTMLFSSSFNDRKTSSVEKFGEVVSLHFMCKLWGICC